MTNQFIAPIAPNMGGQEASVAGSSAAIFTAQDRKLIEEITKEPVQKKSFREIFLNKPLTQKVENEESTAESGAKVKEIQTRYQEHRQPQKYHGQITPKEQAQISKAAEAAETRETSPPPAEEKQKPSDHEEIDLHKKAAAIAKELNFDPAELFDRFHLRQNELLSLICRIRELHLKRLLSEKETEFEELSSKIKDETLKASKSEAKTWLEAQLNNLTREAVSYKLGILQSLQAMEFDHQRDGNIKWLQKRINHNVNS